jgi:hypothetical protein
LFGQPSECGCSSFDVIGFDSSSINLISEENINYSYCLDIRGTLIIDEPTEWDNIKVIMREGSKIVVEDTFALINGTYLTGCTTMWQGIHTTEHVKLTLIDCTIEMAEFGVKLADQTTFICRNVDFIDNFIGISVGSPFDDNNDFVKVAQEGEITGCQFYTVGYLPDPYPGHYYEEWPEPDGQVFYHRGFAAVFMKNSIGLTLGSWTAQDTQRNNVYDMRNGVIMLNSQSYISGTDFHDFEGQFPAGLRIALLRTNQVGIYSNNSVATIE